MTDHPDHVAQGKPFRDLRDGDHLVSRSVMGIWFAILFFGAFLHVSNPHRPVLLAKADSQSRSMVLLLLQHTFFFFFGIHFFAPQGTEPHVALRECLQSRCVITRV